MLLGWICASGAVSGLAQSLSSVTLAWNASPGPDLLGYYVYYGLAAHNYTSKIFVGNSTVATIPGLQPGKTYYFAVTAFDSLGRESGFSNEASYSVPAQSPAPPAIVLNSPGSGASYTALASIGMAASVTANGHVINEVQFYNGGGLLGQNSTAPYTFTWSGVAAGSYTLSARVIYDGGAGIDSAPATVNVANPPPAVTLSSPAAGTSYSAPASLDLAAAVQANENTINEVQFYNGSALLGQSFSAPYAWTWSGVGAGSYSLKAKAIYNGSSAVDSPSVTLTVNSLPLPWQTADVGQPGLTGSASVSGGDYLLAGAGNIGGTSDNFRFVYQPLSGDGWMLVQVASMQSSGGTGSAGLMMRESLSSGARCAYVGVSAGGALFSEERSSTGTSSAAAGIGSGTPPNVTLYLFRTGDSFYYYAYNGTSWVGGNLGTISMASNIYVGLAAASGNTSSLLSGDLEQVTIFP